MNDSTNDDLLRRIIVTASGGTAIAATLSVLSGDDIFRSTVAAAFLVALFYFGYWAGARDERRRVETALSDQGIGAGK